MRSSNPDYPITAGVSSAQAARARHHSYALISRILLEGITAVLLPYLQKVQELSERLPSPFNADDAAAVHYHIFGFNVFAYESVFLDAGGAVEGAATTSEGAQKAGGVQLGGDVTSGVEEAYRRAGYRPGANDLSPDHIGYELAFMAFLCGAEVDAWEDGLPKVAQQVQARQKAFLQGHLLRWLPALSEAIRRQGQSFYEGVADLLEELVFTHALELSVLAPAGDWLPQPPDLLGEKATGVKQIAQYLATPAFSGLYLSRDTLADLARERNLPRGFGGRQQLLENLMRAAAQYETAGDLIEALEALAGDWVKMYDLTVPPALKDFANPWRHRAALTRRLLQDMATQIQSNSA